MLTVPGTFQKEHILLKSYQQLSVSSFCIKRVHQSRKWKNYNYVQKLSYLISSVLLCWTLVLWWRSLVPLFFCYTLRSGRVLFHWSGSVGPSLAGFFFCGRRKGMAGSGLTGSGQWKRTGPLTLASCSHTCVSVIKLYNFVLAKARWWESLVSHWIRITDLMIYSTACSRVSEKTITSPLFRRSTAFTFCF